MFVIVGDSTNSCKVTILSTEALVWKSILTIILSNEPLILYLAFLFITLRDTTTITPHCNT